jgi:hypothetical protein
MEFLFHEVTVRFITRGFKISIFRLILLVSSNIEQMCVEGGGHGALTGLVRS